ncbi:hypothetical protein [Candidatus Protofrankia californiensis]|uniref:hypothetical protein n=1 Tax=Candidatus Protofrankia californiensis TaxID=1839754 RepID=UPI001041BBCA|nr:hypothetical protein [Candidatus Protofrankia californiensis]
MNRPTDWDVLDLDGDPTPGDPFAVRALARRYLEFAADVEHASGQITALATGGVVHAWIGQAGDAYRDELDEFPNQLHKLETSHRMAGQALKAYEPILAAAQTQADRALVHGRDARARRDQAQMLTGPAQTALTSASSTVTALTPAFHIASTDVPPPDPAQVAQAIRNRDAAQTRFGQARNSVQAAQDDLDAARRLAHAARQLREDAAKTCTAAIRDASHAGIRNKPWWSWEKVKQAAGTVWTAAVQVSKITVAVLGVVALVIGGPAAWIVFAAALVVLADTLVRYGNGHASRWDVGFALLDTVPGGKGITTTAGLARGLTRTGKVLRGGRTLAHTTLTAARTHLAGMATNLRGARAYTTTLAKNLLPQPALAGIGDVERLGGAPAAGRSVMAEARGSFNPGGRGPKPRGIKPSNAALQRRPESSYTPDDLTRITDHLGRPDLDHSPANDAMIERIHQSMTDGRPLSEGELNFMQHELTEAELMDGGMSYEDAHELALQTHPLMKNYTPEVIDQFPEMFNNNWRRAWGMEPR